MLRDLYQAIDGKIELRQVGARDAARVQGGIGPCGRDLCCATFLTDFEPVSVRMAKDQDLPVNPLKISGACGRLMCCLKYEHPLYQEFKAQAPAVGATVGTPDGDGRVIAHEVPRDAVVVRLAASGTACRCSRADVCAPATGLRRRPPPPPGRRYRETRHPTPDPVAARGRRGAGRRLLGRLLGGVVRRPRDVDA